MEPKRVPRDMRADTFRLDNPCIEPGRMADFIDAVTHIGGLEGKVTIEPHVPGQMKYGIRADISMPSAEELPSAMGRFIQSGIPVAAILLIEHRYVVNMILEPERFRQYEGDKAAVQHVYDKIMGVINEYKSG